ncbi:MAG TPA: Asp/Glu racemase [Pseudonocardiaceae bacterium]|nr:Asp/Glu racemase [Pseudonocardiaceae bacterium]
MPADLLGGFAGPMLLTQHGIGMVAPFDFALDRELWRWVPDDVSLYLTRLPYVPVPMTVEMATAISDVAAVHRATQDVLTPEPLVVAYACTSGSFIEGVAGERVLVQTMRAAGAPAAVTTSGALTDALHLLGIKRLAIATPYIDPVTDRLVSYLGECGVEAISSVGLGMLSHIWRVSYSEVVRIVRSVDRKDAEAMFISCTNLPTYDIIEPLERALGKPVLTANQVTMWGALRAMGVESMASEQWLVQASRPSAA